MKDRKYSKNSHNAMEQKLYIQKGLLKKKKKTKKKQRMRMTPHVLYFWKAEDATISNMTF